MRLAVLLALALVACGGAHGPHARPARPLHVTMVRTPPAVLASCRRNPLVRPICPGRVPGLRAVSRPGRLGWYCGLRGGHETVHESVVLFPTRRCAFASWSYEYDAGSLYVHVDLEASMRRAGERTGAVSLGAAPWPHGRHRITDALLDPRRRRGVSLGWVRWSAGRGRLVLAPPYATAGEWGDHVVFYLPPDRRGISYAVTLHASWRPLTNVVAALKAMVGSAPGPPVSCRTNALLRSVCPQHVGRGVGARLLAGAPERGGPTAVTGLGRRGVKFPHRRLARALAALRALVAS